jgi:hypothetical protein
VEACKRNPSTAVANVETILVNYIITITFNTADATYASHDAVMNALASANGSSSSPTTIIVPALPLVGGVQQLISTVTLA